MYEVFIILVYRVENDEGTGPYWSGLDSLQEMSDEHNYYSDKHPGLKDEFGIFACDRHKWRSGFEKLTQLYEWFDGWIPALRESGFELAIYEVDESTTLISECQLVFVPETSKLVSKYVIGEGLSQEITALGCLKG